MLYNPDNNKGLLVNRLKNQKTEYDKKQKALRERIGGDSDQDEEEPIDLSYFEHCAYDRNDKQGCEQVKINLKATLKKRIDFLKNSKIDLNLKFPCLLNNPELVTF